MNPNPINPIYILLHLFGRRYNASQHSVFVKKKYIKLPCFYNSFLIHIQTLWYWVFSFVFSRYFWLFNYRIHSLDRGERLPQKNWSSALLSPKYKLHSKHSSTLKHIIYSKLLFITLELPHIQYGPVYTID